MEPRDEPRQYICLLDQLIKSLVDEHKGIGQQITEIAQNVEAPKEVIRPMDTK
jgi:hypothetical protein